jgi:predicted peptidase
MPALRAARAAALALALAGCAGRGGQGGGEPEAPMIPAEPGLHQAQIALEGLAEPLRYTLWVPAAAGPRPLVLALHYGGPVTPWYGRGVLEALALPALEGLDAYIVAPDCPGQGWADPSSQAAVEALLDALAAELPVDTARQAVAGFSMGGIGSWYYAGAQADRFAAALPVAGRPEPAWVDRVAVPVYAINSRIDTVIPIGPAEEAAAALQARGAPVTFVVIEDLTHYQTPRFAPYLEAAVPWLQAIWGT